MIILLSSWYKTSTIVIIKKSNSIQDDFFQKCCSPVVLIVPTPHKAVQPLPTMELKIIIKFKEDHNKDTHQYGVLIRVFIYM